MRDDTKQSYKARILRVLTHIQQHLDEALSIEELAGVAHFSPYHFHRIFRAMVGEPLISHVRRLRIERGAYQLKHSQQSVTRIAFDAGYETHEAFTRAFSALFEMAPSAFRKLHSGIKYRALPSGVHYNPRGNVEELNMEHSTKEPLKVELITLKPARIAFVRHTGPYNQVGSAWQALMMNRAVNKHKKDGGLCCGLCYDDPTVTDAERIRYDACVEVDGKFVADGDIGVMEFEGGQYARSQHVGPYDGLEKLYDRMYGEWLPSSGRETCHSPTVEFYHNSPMDTAAEKLITDVCIPIETN